MKYISNLVLLLSFVSVAHAMEGEIPSDGTINKSVARALSYDAFKDDMEQYGGLKQIAASGNFYKTDWKRFQEAIASYPLESRAIAPLGTYFSTSEYGSIDVVLKNQKARK